MTRANSVHKQAKALTWNMAAVNNNPFEYWITNDDPEHNAMMKSVSDFIAKTPADKDVPVSQVFTQKMFDSLADKMERVGWKGVDEVRERYRSEYANRTIISGFIKDGMIGKKRLAS